MTTLGIDLSTSRIDLVYLDDDGPGADWERVRLPRRDPTRERAEEMIDVLRHIRHAMPRRSELERRAVHLVAIEDPYSAQSHTAKRLGQVFGAIVAVLPPELRCRPLPPQEWKQRTVGAAKADKDDVLRWARNTWPLAPSELDHNGADAYGVAFAVREIQDALDEEARRLSTHWPRRAA